MPKNLKSNNNANPIELLLIQDLKTAVEKGRLYSVSRPRWWLSKFGDIVKFPTSNKEARALYSEYQSLLIDAEKNKTVFIDEHSRG